MTRTSFPSRFSLFCTAGIIALGLLGSSTAWAALVEATLSVDPESRYPRITYRVPESAPAEITVNLRYRKGDGEWRPAAIEPVISHAAMRLTPGELRERWQKGEQVERQAAGQQRTYLWTPYGALAPDEEAVYTLRGEMRDAEGVEVGAFEVNVTLDNHDVEVIRDFAGVVGERAGITQGKEGGEGNAARHFLNWRTSGEVAPEEAIVLGPRVEGRYAIYLGGESQGWISINGRPYRRLRPALPASESLLGVYELKPKSVRFLPMPTGTGAVPLKVSGLRFVPVKAVEKAEVPVGDKKLVVGYFEPYSWAFWRLIRSEKDYQDVVDIYQDAGIQMMDTQFGRFGSRLFYETEAFREDRFNAEETQGDQGGKAGTRSRSLKVWSLLRNSRPLAGMRHAAEKRGMMLHANFGATNAYPGLLPLQSEFSKKHPDLHRKRGNFLALGEETVQTYMLGIYRETLEMGASGISIDFCRYPYGADNAEQVTGFLRRLRALADEYSPRRKILIRFPAQGERRSSQYQYALWIKEGLVDYLCPGNIFSTVLHFDPAPYVAAAKGSECKVLPVMDLIPAGGFRFAEPLLQRADEIYRAGADGIYLYQPDAHLFYFNPVNQAVALLNDPAAVAQELEAIAARRVTASKSLLIEPPSHAFLGGYRTNNDRVRFWLEGEIGPQMEVLEGNTPVHDSAGYPYVFGAEATDEVPPVGYGKHLLKARARDGDGWFEESYEVTIVAPHQWD